jgi:hypothetical protein
LCFVRQTLFHAEVPAGGNDKAENFFASTGFEAPMTEVPETYDAFVDQADIQAMKRVIRALQLKDKEKKKKRRHRSRSRSRSRKRSCRHEEPSRSRRRSPTTESSHEPIQQDEYLIVEPEDLPGDQETADENEDDAALARELEEHFGH